MADEDRIGTIGWIDLTVDDADGVRDFYRDVVGWGAEKVPMGDYEDYCMTTPAAGEAAAGVCHARGSNADLPASWLIYITVDDVDRSAARCVELGGEVIVPPRSVGTEARYCVIRDPAGAVAALYAETEGSEDQPE